MLPPKTPLATPYYRLLSRLWHQGPAPMIALLRELDLSRTVGQRITAQMAEEGVAALEDTGNWAIQASYGTVLGLHLGTGTISTALVNYAGELVQTKDFDYPDGTPPLDQVILGTVARMEPFLRPPMSPPLRGIAVSLPGIVDPYRLVLLESNPLRIRSPWPLKDLLGRPLGRPISVENDANCCCWGEAVLQRRRTLGDFLFLLVEKRPHTVGGPAANLPNYAAGLGLYLGGAVHHGARFSAGEFQSILKNRTDSRSQFSLSDQDMLRAFVDPDLEEALARELGRHTAFLVNTLDLDRVFLSWPRQENADRVAALFAEEIRRNRSYDRPVCPVELPSMGYLAPAYGAAALHLESLFQTADGPAPYYPGKS